MKTYVLSVLVRNHTGVLSRVAGLFSRRAYNIDSLSVGETEDKNISRMTVVTSADEPTFIQIKNQLAKLQEVIEIHVLNRDNAVLREHVLVKVDGKHRSGVMEVAEIFRASIVDICEETLTVELTGGPSKINAFIEMLSPYGIEGLVRTGLTGMLRGRNDR